jgi:DNA polymerase-3 subunit gamma/tau
MSTSLEGVAPLATKYRPSTFADVVGQKSTVAALEGILLKRRVPNALLFYGPPGTGKTTLARLFARYLNCKTHNACGTCDSCRQPLSQHPDITEQNAASERGIDSVKALVEKTRFRPRYNYRVFILDEAHQLTAEGRDAFLKTLEEPPSHTLFILCTTDPQKFSAAMLTRCIQFGMEVPDPNDVALRLRKVARLEKLDVSKEVLVAIAQTADGCVREALNMLDMASMQLALTPKLDTEKLLSKLGSTASYSVQQHAANLLLAIYSGNKVKIAKAVFENDQPILAVITQAFYLNDFVFSQRLKVRSKLVFPSKANVAFSEVVAKAHPDLKGATFIEANSRLVAVRNTLHIVSTREHNLLIALLTNDL